MKRTTLNPTLAFLAAVSVALVLALAAPNETHVMGQLPALTAKRLDQQRVVLPQGLPAERTLALVAFTRGQRAEIDSWIEGLRLNRDASIPWVRMPVINDPGDDGRRNAIESRVAERHPAPQDRARLVPVFTDREAFIRAAGLTSGDHASVLVVDRDGRILARAEGRYDEAKAQALRETLLARND